MYTYVEIKYKRNENYELSLRGKGKMASILMICCTQQECNKINLLFHDQYMRENNNLCSALSLDNDTYIYANPYNIIIS